MAGIRGLLIRTPVVTTEFQVSARIVVTAIMRGDRLFVIVRNRNTCVNQNVGTKFGEQRKQKQRRENEPQIVSISQK